MVGEVCENPGKKFFFIRTTLGKDVFCLRSMVEAGEEVYAGAVVNFGLGSNPRRPSEEMAIDIVVRKFEAFARGLPTDTTHGELSSAITQSLGDPPRKLTLKAAAGLAWLVFGSEAALKLALDGAIEFRGRSPQVVPSRTRNAGEGAAAA